MLGWTRPVAFVNARVVTDDGLATSLRFATRVLALDTGPRRGDVVVDLEGAVVLPGLINAHDHLELNHYGALKCRERYVNASAWIEDLRPALRNDPTIRQKSAFPLRARLLIGGLKSVLAGVTTVAHHNPRYSEIGRAFPVRVVTRYGWAHSFALQRQPVGAHGEMGGDVRARCLETASGAPFMVHLGEGTDEAAAAELSQLEAIDCLRANTVLVHGVALTPSDWDRVLASGASLVWCPASNYFLFGQTAPVRRFLDAAPAASWHVCLGSDSRVTGARDLLDELRIAMATIPVDPCDLLRMVTRTPARMLRLRYGGRIEPGVPADLLIVPAGDDPGAALLATSRRDVLLVTIDGRPVVGSPSFKAVFDARRVATGAIAVDGIERLAARGLARVIAQNPIQEVGVECLP